MTFDYTYPYAGSPSGQANSLPRPRVPVRVIDPMSKRSTDMSFLVDTGADVTSLPSGLAAFFGLSLQTLRTQRPMGVGTSISYEYQLDLQLCGMTVAGCRVFFTDNLGELLLGRETVFDQLSFAFEQCMANVHVVNANASQRISVPAPGQTYQVA